MSKGQRSSFGKAGCRLKSARHLEPQRVRLTSMASMASNQQKRKLLQEKCWYEEQGGAYETTAIRCRGWRRIERARIKEVTRKQRQGLAAKGKALDPPQ